MIKEKSNFKKIANRCLFTGQIFIINLLFLLPLAAYGADPVITPLEFKPQITIPGTEFTGPVKVGSYTASSGEMTSDLLNRYIFAFYDYGLAVAGILATIVLMGGGIIWLMSGGDAGKIGQAKELISGSISGVLILVVAWIILNTVNPDLINLKSIKTQVIKKVAYCCDPKSGNVIMEKDGTCPEGGSTQCPIGQSCKASGDNTFTCAADKDSYCCEYKPASGAVMPLKCVTIPFNGSQCPSQTGFLYSQSYAGFYCGNKTVMGTNCKAGDCVGIESGDYCEGVLNGEGYCYNEMCWMGLGKENEPCGNEANSKCDKDEKQNGFACIGDGGGRSCNSGLWCCKFNPDGTRKNKSN